MSTDDGTEAVVVTSGIRVDDNDGAAVDVPPVIVILRENAESDNDTGALAIEEDFLSVGRELSIEEDEVDVDKGFEDAIEGAVATGGFRAAVSVATV